MSFPEFAYSTEMQIILALVSFATTFLSMCLVAQIILAVFQVSATRLQKALFAFITGAVMQSAWVYLVYFLGGSMSFGPVRYVLVTSPNPITALLYYYVAIRVFRLSPVRSAKMMSYVYAYWILNKTVNRLLGSFFFVQREPRYNYMLDTMQQLAMLALFFAMTMIALYLIRRHSASPKFTDNAFFNKRRELILYTLKATFIYAVVVMIPLALAERIAANIIINLILILFFALYVVLDLNSYHRQTVSNQEVHIGALLKVMEEFRGVKHDFLNILLSYSGYLEVGAYDKLKEYHASLVETITHAGCSLDLARRSAENPALVSLLISKTDYAAKMNVKLMVSLKCSLGDFYIGGVDFCRVLGCLLDNAIEAAAESDEMLVYFTAEAKENGSKLIIITNSTRGAVDVGAIRINGVTNKRGHTGIGLSNVTTILHRYGNCTFHMNQYNNEVSVYLELLESA